MPQEPSFDPELQRLAEDSRREQNWKRWGPYLSERQWGTVREDYSASGNCWDYFPHDHARSRAYRWGEDGLLGICDRQCRLCFAVALWNERDPILKERLFGLTNSEGNHGEDVKEEYFYLDATPTHSYLKGLYKYPQAEFPYAQLVAENARRGVHEREFELADTGVFDEGRYFDVGVEYAKASPNDLLIRIRVTNRGPERAPVHVLPTLWFRNTWSWGCLHEGCWPKPGFRLRPDGSVRARHASLGTYRFAADPAAGDGAPTWLFADNETNSHRLFGIPGPDYPKDAIHDYVVHGRADAVDPTGSGTKAAAHFRLLLDPGETRVLQVRLAQEDLWPREPFGTEFGAVFADRLADADQFYAARIAPSVPEAAQRVMRQGYAGLLWTKQFYHYSVRDWLDGDPEQPVPPTVRNSGRNRDWGHLFNRDIISMPDKWEYPWYAAWDLAFHMIPFAHLDPEFSREQLILMLREWYMHPNGQIPAYEFAFNDVNPPVHAWAAWRIYKISGARGQRDRLFLERVFQKLLLNFTWWVNRKDRDGRHLFAGGFLGLDNVGVFDRSQPLPDGGWLEQADGTAWMAFYCEEMLSIALELASEDPAYEDVASKFFEHFVAIVDALNHLGGTGLWNEEDGFYYDRITHDHAECPVRLRSMVGLIPLIAVEVLDEEVLARLPGFRKRMEWFLENRRDVAHQITYMEAEGGQATGRRLLAIPSRERLVRVLGYLLDEDEFLSPYGIRSLSKAYESRPFVLRLGAEEYRVRYDPGESTTRMFGGNSNWRGPIWFPVNYLLLEALERYHHFYGDNLRVECPTGSGILMNLAEVAREISSRLARLFLPDEDGHAPWQGDDHRFATDPGWKDLVLFHEYFHGDTGRGLGASHQTGWTALVIRLLNDLNDTSEIRT